MDLSFWSAAKNLINIINIQDRNGITTYIFNARDLLSPTSLENCARGTLRPADRLLCVVSGP